MLLYVTTKNTAITLSMQFNYNYLSKYSAITIILSNINAKNAIVNNQKSYFVSLYTVYLVLLLSGLKVKG